MKKLLLLSLLLFGPMGCASAPPRSCPGIDEEQLAARIADSVYERLRREGHLRTVGDEVPPETELVSSPDSAPPATNP